MPGEQQRMRECQAKRDEPDLLMELHERVAAERPRRGAQAGS